MPEEFDPKGIERNHKDLVPIGGKLPLCIEAQTGKLLDLLLEIFQEKLEQESLNRSKQRKKIGGWLYRKTRPGFYIELNENLHLAYADQRDGSGSQHWWRLFFDEKLRSKVERATKSSALTTIDKKAAPPSESNGTGNGSKEWGGMYFRSESEIKIAEELERQGLLFFANIRGRINKDKSPISAKIDTGRLEIDFLIFHRGKCISLEVDGLHHNDNGQIQRDYSRDRLLLKEGITTARFLASECYENPEEVVTELLNLLH